MRLQKTENNILFSFENSVSYSEIEKNYIDFNIN